MYQVIRGMKYIFKINSLILWNYICIIYLKISPSIAICNYDIEGSIKKSSVGNNIAKIAKLLFFFHEIGKKNP